MLVWVCFQKDFLWSFISVCRNLQKLANGVDPARKSKLQALYTDPSMDFERPNWLSVQIPRTASQDLNGINKANNLWAMNSTKTDIFSTGRSQYHAPQRSVSTPGRQLSTQYSQAPQRSLASQHIMMTSETVQLEHVPRPLSSHASIPINRPAERSLMHSTQAHIYPAGHGILDTSASQAYATPKSLLNTNLAQDYQTGKSKEKKGAKLWKTTNLKRIFSLSVRLCPFSSFLSCDLL